ncbi:DASS family sodium-coupled anion symporter [Parvularcula dongshanensis]|uniref:Sodium-dependent dicarboxylate transporter 2/3/5 n=1 Tax=Parvularcula dongshanensis TaxID=1173995 RepID=A0A840I6M0_9PROT|nr:sodium-dependent dicarboxylate transporter 2/3/5 [Parvularcula dongshanensis]
MGEEADGTGGQSDRTARGLGLVLGVAAFVTLLLLPLPGELSFDARVILALLALMACWWVFEAIPIPITSLSPLVVLPLFGVTSMGEASAPYFSPIIVLLLGGFIVARSVERWNLHERLALLTVSRAGAGARGMIAGFLCASALLSAWISNTATTIMLMPVALSVAASLGARRGASDPLSVGLILAVAYGASIGGLATPIGTPTNLIVLGGLEAAGHGHIGFPAWMAFGVPTVALLLGAAYLVLSRLRGVQHAAHGGEARALVRERLAALGAWSVPERRTLIVLGVLAFFWIARGVLQSVEIGGVAPLAGLSDAGIAVAGAIAVFLVPSGSMKERGTALLDWEGAVRLPWGVVLLFGGGLSLASAVTATGLGAAMASGFVGLGSLPAVLVILVLTTFVIFATELTSNVATAAALTPVIVAMAAGAGLVAEEIAMPVALAATCAFMFPMATAPNAIAYATGELSIARMARIGLRLNLIGILIITAVARFLVPAVT